MAHALYRASFFLYEVSFMLLAAALVLHALSLRKVNRALRQPAFWIWPLVGAGLIFLCSVNHFYVYYFLSPRYITTQSHQLLLQMYWLKTFSMLGILGAGLALLVSHGLYLFRTSH